MPVEIHVPELGESVADATVGTWLKQEGDAVKAGEELVVPVVRRRTSRASPR
jgi:2-oxoglutarate dehydrogenase E2 component (dihydrolipoamide succinyltransferase)